MMRNDHSAFRIAAASDLHYSRNSKGHAKDLFAQASEEADVLVLCGDLTDYGLPDEAHVLGEDLHASCRIPVVAVLGNHDYESEKTPEVIKILEAAGMHILDGECLEIGGVGFVGISGFGGGFGARMLSAWGEPAIKHFVQESVDQALKLERALGRLRTKRKIALLHYSPIRETVVGEDPEIFPFLGSTRLEGPLNRFQVDAAFHGHAHNGTLRGHTSAGIPVFNVAPVILKRTQPAPFFSYTLEMDPAAEPAVAAALI